MSPRAHFDAVPRLASHRVVGPHNSWIWYATRGGVRCGSTVIFVRPSGVFRSDG